MLAAIPKPASSRVFGVSRSETRTTKRGETTTTTTYGASLLELLLVSGVVYAVADLTGHVPKGWSVKKALEGFSIIPPIDIWPFW